MMSDTRKRKTGKEKVNDLENPSDDEKKAREQPRKSSKIVVLICGLVIAIILLYIVIVPSPIDPINLKTNHPLPYFEGVLEPNYALQNIVKILPENLQGPESIQVDRDGNIFTGLHDGRIVKITPAGKIVNIIRIGESLPECGNVTFEHRCGRPLGLQFDKDEKNLIICDAYFGLLKYNLETSNLTTLIPAAEGLEGHPFKFLNSLAISSTGKVYFTDSSWKWERRDFIYLIMEGGGQGRLMSYDLNTGEKEVLLNGLFFPNGVALSPDEEFVVVCETTVNRIMRLFLKGSRKGIYDLFSDNLPGVPDNIHPSRDGGYWVALPSIRKWPFSLLDSIGPYPNLKNLIVKLFPKNAIEGMVKKYGLILKLDYYGDILESYHDPDGSVVNSISEVYEDPYNEGVLYIGSFRNNFIGKLRLADVKSKEQS